jgi:hypothetical protein
MMGTRRAGVACAACTCALGAALCAAPRAAVAQRQSTSVARPVGVGVTRAAARRAPVMIRPSFLSQVPADRGRPEVEPARVVGELFTGAYAGIGGYFLGSWAAGGVADLFGEASDDMKDHIGFVGGVLGAGLATAASVAAIGNIGDQTGSFPTAIAGTAAGVAVGIVLNQVIYGHARLPSEGESSRLRWVEASLEAMLPSIGATIAFNSTRRFK